MRKLLTVILSFVMLVTVCVTTGCGPKNGATNDDKTHFSVGLFKAGLGREWLDQAIIDFEKKYENVSFEEGKLGVKVDVDYKVAEFKVGTFSSNVKTLSNSIYFLDQSDYALYAKSGMLRSISDIIDNKVYDSNGNLVNISFDAATGKLSIPNGAKSIKDIMLTDYIDYFKYADGNYYSIPYYLDISGIVYDADYFDSAKLYFFQEADENGYKMGATLADIERGESLDGREVGYGPDRVKGTSDDGMPENWNDFLDMMSNMQGATPFIWSGAENYQRKSAYNYIWANYEGYDNYIKNFALEESVSTLVEQEGRKAAIKAFYDILKGDYYYKDFSNTDEYMSELKYVRSVNDNQRFAMLLDGGYWEVNMIEEFKSMGVSNENMGWGKRNFKLLPIPNFVGVSGIKDQTVFGPEVLHGSAATQTIVCLPSEYKNQNDVQDSLAELFLYFTHEREQLVQFTAFTGGCIKPYNFELKEGDKETLTKFGQSIFDFIEDGAKIVTGIPTTETVRNNYGVMFGENSNSWRFNIDNKYINPIDWFLYSDVASTVQDCYNRVVATAKNKCNFN